MVSNSQFERNSRMKALINAACDRQLSADEQLELQQWLLEDPWRIDEYLETIRFHAELGWQLHPASALSADELLQHEEAERTIETCSAMSPSKCNLSERNTAQSGTLTSTNSISFFAPTVIGLMIGFILGFIAFKLTLERLANPDQFSAALVQNGASKATSDLFFSARVIGQSNCVLRDSQSLDDLLVNSWLVPDTEIELESGKLEISFADGAIVSLIGPARFEIDTFGVGILKFGKLTANVPVLENQFKIRASDLDFVSLGSKHQLEVNEAGVAELSVHSGAVRYEAHDGLTVHERAGRVGNHLVSYVLPNTSRTVDASEFTTVGSKDVVDVSGQIVCLKDRPSVVGKEAFHEKGILLIPEVGNVPMREIAELLPESISKVTQKAIEENLNVDSYLVCFQPRVVNNNGDRTALGSITFSQPIIGTIESTECLSLTDGILGFPEVQYAGGKGRGLEIPPDQNFDRIALSSDRCTVLMNLRVREGFWDQMRILVLSDANGSK